MFKVFSKKFLCYNGFMKKIFLISLLLFCSNFAFADTLKFAQVSDIHLQQPEISYEHRDLSHSKENFYKAMDTLKEDSSIQYIFFTGDFVDRSFENLLEEFFAKVNTIDKPYFLALGNHDSNSPNGLVKKDVLKILKKKSYKHKARANYAVKLNEDFLAIMLDPTSDVGISAQGYYKQSTLRWLERTLKRNQDKNVMIFQHFPVVEPCSEFDYLYPHNIKNKADLLAILEKYNNVILIASGHYHVAGEFEQYGIKHYSTPALFLIPSYYRIFEIDYDGRKINAIKSELILNRD